MKNLVVVAPGDAEVADVAVEVVATDVVEIEAPFARGRTAK